MCILKQNLDKKVLRLYTIVVILISILRNKLGVEKGWFIMLCFISIGLAASNISQVTILSLWQGWPSGAYVYHSLTDQLWQGVAQLGSLIYLANIFRSFERFPQIHKYCQFPLSCEDHLSYSPLFIFFFKQKSSPVCGPFLAPAEGCNIGAHPKALWDLIHFEEKIGNKFAEILFNSLLLLIQK